MVMSCASSTTAKSKTGFLVLDIAAASELNTSAYVISLRAPREPAQRWTIKPCASVPECVSSCQAARHRDTPPNRPTARRRPPVPTRLRESGARTCVLPRHSPLLAAAHGPHHDWRSSPVPHAIYKAEDRSHSVSEHRSFPRDAAHSRAISSTWFAGHWPVCRRRSLPSLEQRQFCDARAEARRRFHRDGAAEGMADKIDLVRVLWQRRFHHASLIV